MTVRVSNATVIAPPVYALYDVLKASLPGKYVPEVRLGASSVFLNQLNGRLTKRVNLETFMFSQGRPMVNCHFEGLKK